MIIRTSILLIAVAIILCGEALATTNSKTIDDSSKKLSKDFIERQVVQNMSVGKAIKSLVSHYPAHAHNVVSTALDLYPDSHREIVHSAISAQPALTQEIVQIAIDKGVTQCSKIVEAAIMAEPSYVDFVVKAAVNAKPQELDDIVRIAVVTEPDSADSIVQTLASSYPHKTTEILQTALEAVPFVGEYIIEALLAIFPEKAEDVINTAVKESLEDETNLVKMLEAAKAAGVNEQELFKYATTAGASEEQIKTALNNLKK